MTTSYPAHRVGRSAPLYTSAAIALCGFALTYISHATLYAQTSISVPYSFAKYSLHFFSQRSNLGTNIVNHIRYSPVHRRVWLAGRNGLVWTDDGGITFNTITAVPRFNQNGIQGLDVRGQRIWASSSRITEAEGRRFPTGDGLMYSDDGGTTWREVAQPLDSPADSIERYGFNTLRALPITVPQQNVIYDIAIGNKDSTVWVATWSGGIRRTQNNGRSWQRMVLPPTGRQRIAPTDTLSFQLEPRRGARGDLVFLGFSVLQASDGAVWVGTVDGICRTDDPDALYPSWVKFNRTFGGLSGNWVTAIREQPATPRLGRAIWAATWQAESRQEAFGVSWTRDNGNSWQTALLGERIYDFAFRGDTVYAVGTNGLFISPDGGETWLNRRGVQDRDNPRLLIQPQAEMFALGIEPLGRSERLWLGSEDGTATSTDGGNTWKILRADLPVPEGTKTYAYPNPFAPRLDGSVRIRYALSQPARVTIRIYDFAMNLVKTVVQNAPRSRSEEEDFWNGRSDAGTKVANGVYFYIIQADGQKPLYGKIMVLE
ncbi:MAG: hypothetical protein RMI34_03640 [Chloroherpetonaceae bacterium]|nr:hypothetical protein [Chloroherpetonaceae bacterium]MCS7210235.1 hypothetical protein [Chloroherpetonaceae bacterium]MDW8019153.1 hypothetical protein [Chloroherpetonaceae bacterium]MDW8466897.1 hypothetical protein [Chloroherpetonaceae bacterium]